MGGGSREARSYPDPEQDAAALAPSGRAPKRGSHPTEAKASS